MDTGAIKSAVDMLRGASSSSIGSRPMPPVRTGQQVSSDSFSSFLRESITQVSAMQQDADQAVEALMTGNNNSPAEVLTAVQKADLAFQLMLQVRNKLVAAFDEVKNLRI